MIKSVSNGIVRLSMSDIRKSWEDNCAESGWIEALDNLDAVGATLVWLGGFPGKKGKHKFSFIIISPWGIRETPRKESYCLISDIEKAIVSFNAIQEVGEFGSELKLEG